MRQEERQLLEEYGKKLDRLLLIVAGDEEYGIKGLVQRQNEDEQWQKEINSDLKQIQTNQEKMFSSLQNHAKRLVIVERFYKIIQNLSKIKKKTVALVVTIASIITGAVAFWEKIQQLFTK